MRETHFFDNKIAEECNLPELISRKMEPSEIEYLGNEDSKLINLKAKILTNQTRMKEGKIRIQKSQNAWKTSSTIHPSGEDV